MAEDIESAEVRLRAQVSRSQTLGLSQEVLQSAKALLSPPLEPPDGNIERPFGRSCLQVSEFLHLSILKEFEADPDWLTSHPILLGSWGRRELAPKSDLDVLFLGSEEVVGRFVERQMSKGIRIRSRIPADKQDWSVGVETPDLLALWKAQPLTEEGHLAWRDQREKIFSSKRKKKILRDLIRERKQRTVRNDNQANYLEPNLKYGPGGLRDLYQGLVVRDLFFDCFQGDGHELRILNYYFLFFLTLRQAIHFQGGNEVLTGPDQLSLSQWMGASSHQEFMRQVQRGLSRVSFYSEWIFEKARAQKRKKSTKALKTPQDLALSLKKDPSHIQQHLVRRSLQTVFTGKVSEKMKGKILSQVLDVRSSEDWLIAVFRSRLIDYLCPRFVRLLGLTQHDQYHRLTADAHLLQACREVKRVYKRPKELGALSWMHRKFKKADWEILSWTALYHDIAKGLPEDHSHLGEAWVREDLKKYGVSKKAIDEIAWMVRNHLLISEASFKKNPKSPQTWAVLKQFQVTEERLLRLTVFTALDIRATNLEAWNSWKSRLMDSLAKSYLEKSTQGYLEVKERLPKAISHLEVDKIDTQIFDVFPAKKIIQDLNKLSNKKEKSVEFFTDRYRKTWIRIFEPQDRSGLLEIYLTLLYELGCSVQHAVVNTFADFGVYDWFQVQTKKQKGPLKKIIEKAGSVPSVNLQKIQFSEISLVSEDDIEWVILFRGFDQKGCLLKATQMLTEQGAFILSARVHTWGKQIDDLFSVRPVEGLSASDWISRLKSSGSKISTD